MSDKLLLAFLSLGIWAAICVLPICLLIHAVSSFLDREGSAPARIDIRSTDENRPEKRARGNGLLMVLAVTAYVVVSQLLIIEADSLAGHWGLYVEDLSESISLWICPYLNTIAVLVLVSATLVIIRLPKARTWKLALFHAFFWPSLYFVTTTCYVIVYSAVGINGVLVNQIMMIPTSIWMIGIFTWGIVLACTQAKSANSDK